MSDNIIIMSRLRFSEQFKSIMSKKTVYLKINNTNIMEAIERLLYILSIHHKCITIQTQYNKN